MEQQDSEGERLERISRLLSSQASRAAYIRGKLAVLVPSQIRQLRLKSVNPPMPKQADLAHDTEVHQSRISMFETPGAANVTIDTLSRIAAGLRCGVVIEFVPFSTMLQWENEFSPDSFDVVRLEKDDAFLRSEAEQARRGQASFVASTNQVAGSAESIGSTFGASVAPIPIRTCDLRKPPAGEQAALSAMGG
jgi:hypothetical protein